VGYNTSHPEILSLSELLLNDDIAVMLSRVEASGLTQANSVYSRSDTSLRLRMALPEYLIPET
jgi:hypothetical protein